VTWRVWPKRWARSARENRTKDIALWLADDDEAELIEQKEKEAIERGVKSTPPAAPPVMTTRCTSSFCKARLRMRSSMVPPDDDEAELIEQKEKEAIERGETLGAKGGKKAAQKRKRDLTLDDMYHEGENTPLYCCD
jgi:hypothetical protein